MAENTSSLPQYRCGALAVAGNALVFAGAFLVRNPGAILRRIAIPGALGSVSLYALAWGYCSQLAAFIGSPSEGLAGRVMGVAAVSVLIMLLLHAIVVSRVAGLVTGDKRSRPGLLGVGSDAWRVYAANMQLFLGLGLYGLAIFGTSTLMSRFEVSPEIITTFTVAAWFFLCWLVARSWFLLVPICLQTSEENGLGVSWRSSEGHVPLIGLLTLVIVLFTVVLLAAGEMLMQATGLLSQPPLAPTVVTAVNFFMENLWIFVTMMSVVYLFSVSFSTAVRIRIYQRLLVAPPA